MNINRYSMANVTDAQLSALFCIKSRPMASMSYIINMELRHEKSNYILCLFCVI